MLRHEPTLIATTGYQMTASSPRGTFSQAELTAEAGDNPLYHPPAVGAARYYPAMISDQELAPVYRGIG